jgi:hypothetical protein
MGPKTSQFLGGTGDGRGGKLVAAFAKALKKANTPVASPITVTA